MRTTISTIEDTSSVRFRIYGFLSASEDIAAMQHNAWRDRLAAAIKAEEKSDREVSLAAGFLILGQFQIW